MKSSENDNDLNDIECLCVSSVYSSNKETENFDLLGSDFIKKYK